MSINLQRPIVPAITLQMIDGKTRLLGIPKQKVQVVITLPNIEDFNEQLSDAIEFFKDRADAFIITSSCIDSCKKVVEKFNLKNNLITMEYKEFSKIFKMLDENNNLKKSLMIIDTNCQITHKDIL
ncbi:hypothetical protein CRV08_06905 [Halarcobacter ebronensis]|uniref:Uncharacterized protein n=1 Tax=Halarcobacter ebronensis TaxID=1462615 RepID=A0A4Q0YDW9_9BACT|nr:hypothetical protein [Halarcobacter ebronensis]RXJ68682.1 hypothetical protein CRV08_06905 [Halarcobacter ebronensis]